MSRLLMLVSALNLAGLCLGGCAENGSDFMPDPKVDADKAEAVIAYILSHPEGATRGFMENYCIEVDKKAVTAEALARFNALRPGALPRDRCVWREEAEVIDRQTQKPASILSVSRQACNSSKQRCMISAGNAFGNLGGHGAEYELVRDGNGWKVSETGTSWIS